MVCLHALSAGLLTVAFGTPAAAPPTIREVAEFEGLYDRWVEAMDGLGVPAFAVAVVKDGRLYALDAMGPRDTETGAPIDGDTIFYIASITKTYLAAGIVALAEEGRIDLDAPVRSYLPLFALADEEATSTVTVRDLLCHRPGIDSGPIVYLDAYTGQITEDRYYRWLGRVTPSGSVQYSNVHFTLLGRVIEAVTGESWKDYLQQRIFEPAGMSRTTAYASRMYGDPNAAVPLILTANGWVPSRVRKTDRTMHAAGGMGTTARDAARWIELQFGGGSIDGATVLTEASVADMHAFQSKLEEPRGRIRRREGFGLGWHRGTFRGRPYLTHGGGYVGAATHVSFLPEHGIGVVVFCNSQGPANGLIDIVSIDVYDRLLGETGHADLLPPYKERATQLRLRMLEPAASGANPVVAEEGLSREPEAYVGVFTNADWGAVDVRLADRMLVGVIGDLSLTLHSTATDRFTAVATAGLDFEGSFVVDGEGRVAAVQLGVDDEVIVFDRE